VTSTCKPEPPLPRIVELRRQMNEFGLHDTPIVMAGGVWFLREWADFIGNPDVGPIAFQFGTRPLLTRESPISKEWKDRLLHLRKGDNVLLFGHAGRGPVRATLRRPKCQSAGSSSRCAKRRSQGLAAKASRCGRRDCK
jgi:NAD(P)H-dependent flavin oxidoreductase YrpB (nitropropane dioxygenase family)